MRSVMHVQHEIKLKPSAKPVVQKLRRLGVIEVDDLQLGVDRLFQLHQRFMTNASPCQTSSLWKPDASSSHLQAP